MSTKRQNWDSGIRCGALTLLTFGKTPKEIEEIYKINQKTLSKIKKKALSRRWVESSPVLLEHVQRIPQSDR